MKITIFGNELTLFDERKQFELIAPKKSFGFKVVVTISNVGLGTHVHTYRNVTEIHHRFDTILNLTAFESNVHSTGSTPRDVKEIVVTAETEKGDNFVE
jgi:hypothetical protein